MTAAGGAVALAALWAASRRLGRERRRHLAGLAGRAARGVPVAETAGFVGDKVSAAGRLTLEWLRDLAGAALGWRDGDAAADALAVDLAEELAHAINDHARLVGGEPPGLGRRSPGFRSAPSGGRSRVLAQASSR